MDSKQTVLNKLRPKTYLIYGIFDFREERLVYVSLDQEEAELHYDLEDYDELVFDLIAFKVVVY